MSGSVCTVWGKYSSVGSSEWASCAAGRYSADIGASNCTVACLSGFYSSTVVGASVAKCTIVPAGSYPSENITYSSISASWKGFAASADFTKMVATVSGGYIQMSSDSGSSWTALTNSGSRNWYGITCSAIALRWQPVSITRQIRFDLALD